MLVRTQQGWAALSWGLREVLLRTLVLCKERQTRHDPEQQTPGSKQWLTPRPGRGEHLGELRPGNARQHMKQSEQMKRDGS